MALMTGRRIEADSRRNRWPEPVVLRGQLNTSTTPDGAYASDSLTSPEKNPWNRRVRWGGFDFFSDGRRAAFCTHDGDIWILSGIDDSLERLEWRRFASGQNLTLTIDRRIQFLAYRELKRALADTHAVSGSAVVLDVATGEVLAMANLPSFNPNAVGTAPRDAHRNRAVTDVIEPGSTMKPLTVAAALEAGVITPNTVFDTNPGWIPNGKWKTTDTHNYGVLDVTGVIRKSSNVGSAKIAMRLTREQMYDFYSRFGYGHVPGSGFPGESPGNLPKPDGWSGTTKQTMSYGYGVSVTPLQIARAYAAIGNGGRSVVPTFVKGQGGESEQILDPKIASEVLRMMQTVTEPGGTATQAAILGYHVAGKTGTAWISRNGGYSRRYNAFFAGLVPVDRPRFAMVVVLKDPDPTLGYTGGLAAGLCAATLIDDRTLATASLLAAFLLAKFAIDIALPRAAKPDLKPLGPLQRAGYALVAIPFGIVWWGLPLATLVVAMAHTYLPTLDTTLLWKLFATVSISFGILVFFAFVGALLLNLVPEFDRDGE